MNFQHIVLFISLAVLTHCYLPGVAPKDYIVDDRVKLKVFAYLSFLKLNVFDCAFFFLF